MTHPLRATLSSRRAYLVFSLHTWRCQLDDGNDQVNRYRSNKEFQPLSTESDMRWLYLKPTLRILRLFDILTPSTCHLIIVHNAQTTTARVRVGVNLTEERKGKQCSTCMDNYMDTTAPALHMQDRKITNDARFVWFKPKRHGNHMSSDHKRQRNQTATRTNPCLSLSQTEVHLTASLPHSNK